MPIDELDKQAIKRGDYESIPQNRSDKDLQDEMNARSCKAGLTNRQGESCMSTGKVMVSVPFGEEKLNVWPRDEAGNLID